VGGLIRAYSDAVAAALDQAVLARREQRVRIRLMFPAEVNGGVLSTLNRFPVTMESLVYQDPVHLQLTTPPSQLEPLRAALLEATGARVQWKADP
jgi:putative IMPACT (imprinted ancient) family translation regulator